MNEDDVFIELPCDLRTNGTPWRRGPYVTYVSLFMTNIHIYINSTWSLPCSRDKQTVGTHQNLSSPCNVNCFRTTNSSVVVVVRFLVLLSSKTSFHFFLYYPALLLLLHPLHIFFCPPWLRLSQTSNPQNEEENKNEEDDTEPLHRRWESDLDAGCWQGPPNWYVFFFDSGST